MHRRRYGNLRRIAARTDGACHLCHEPADLTLYGRTGWYGDGTTTVDHLVPQAHGGGDEYDNLMIAHGRCNSFRGTRDAEDVRLALVGTPDAPTSAGAKAVASLGLGAVAALGTGALFARTTETGARQFNFEAALIGGLFCAGLARLAM